VVDGMKGRTHSGHVTLTRGERLAAWRMYAAEAL